MTLQPDSTLSIGEQLHSAVSSAAERRLPAEQHTLGWAARPAARHKPRPQAQRKPGPGRSVGKGAAACEREEGCPPSPTHTRPQLPVGGAGQREEAGKGVNGHVVGTTLGDRASVVSMDPQPGWPGQGRRNERVPLDVTEQAWVWKWHGGGGASSPDTSLRAERP